MPRSIFGAVLNFIDRNKRRKYGSAKLKHYNQIVFRYMPFLFRFAVDAHGRLPDHFANLPDIRKFVPANRHGRTFTNLFGIHRHKLRQMILKNKSKLLVLQQGINLAPQPCTKLFILDLCNEGVYCSHISSPLGK
ncbi:MAG TPA: hypothetical protein PKC89_04580 [Pyrinomonadaceae bacterium]|nr:hypothetical protein [Pyrinomonadaceae bacterium]